MKSILKRLGLSSQNESQDKEESELKYWKIKKEEETNLRNDHYKFFYTDNFGLSDDFFQDKKILDIGCGPRGSLEWADMAAERVGLDPLADEYLKLGASEHKMNYVKAYSEAIPFNDNYFDVVCTFNSIDHVEDLSKSCQELYRVLKPNGLLLLLVDIQPRPTATEPQTIPWNFVKIYFPNMKLASEEQLEKLANGMYDSIKSRVLFNHTDQTERDGILLAKLIKE